MVWLLLVFCVGVFGLMFAWVVLLFVGCYLLPVLFCLFVLFDFLFCVLMHCCLICFIY